MANKDKSLVNVHPNERIDLPDFRAMQNNGRSETRELLRALVLGGWQHRGGAQDGANRKSSFWADAQRKFELGSPAGDNVTTFFSDNRTGASVNFTVRPFVLGASPDGGTLTVRQGVGTAGVFDDDGTPGTEQGVVHTLDVDPDELSAVQYDISGHADGVYHVYVTTVLDETTPSSRVFWNATANNEIGQTVSTRKAINWTVRITADNAERNAAREEGWLMVGRFEKQGGATISVHNYFYSVGEGALKVHGDRIEHDELNHPAGGAGLGYPYQRYHVDHLGPGVEAVQGETKGRHITESLAWGDGDNDRSDNRLHHGCHSLGEFLDAVRRQLADIIGHPRGGSVGRAWYKEMPQMNAAKDYAAPGITLNLAQGQHVDLEQLRAHLENIHNPHGLTLNQDTLFLNSLRPYLVNGTEEGTFITVNGDLNGAGFTTRWSTVIVGNPADTHVKITDGFVGGMTGQVADGGNVTTVGFDVATIRGDSFQGQNVGADHVTFQSGGGQKYFKVEGDGQVKVKCQFDGTTAIQVERGCIESQSGYKAMKTSIPPLWYAGTGGNAARPVGRHVRASEMSVMFRSNSRDFYESQGGNSSEDFTQPNITNHTDIEVVSRISNHGDFGSVMSSQDTSQSGASGVTLSVDLNSLFTSAGYNDASDPLSLLAGYSIYNDPAYAPVLQSIRIYYAGEYYDTTGTKLKVLEVPAAYTEEQEQDAPLFKAYLTRASNNGYGVQSIYPYDPQSGLGGHQGAENEQLGRIALPKGVKFGIKELFTGSQNAIIGNVPRPPGGTHFGAVLAGDNKMSYNISSVINMVDDTFDTDKIYESGMIGINIMEYLENAQEENFANDEGLHNNSRVANYPNTATGFTNPDWAVLDEAHPTRFVIELCNFDFADIALANGVTAKLPAGQFRLVGVTFVAKCKAPGF